jgi:hypothetical protein
MDIAKFRLDFPEFADTTKYPTSRIEYWAGLGESTLSADRFGKIYNQILSLFVAHYLVIATANTLGGQGSGLPGLLGATASSKTVGSVSITYDTEASMVAGAGHWNYTIYGRMYLDLSKPYGMGAVLL